MGIGCSAPGTAEAFGCNDSGEATVPDLAGKKATQATAGTDHTVLLLEDWSVKAFGSNDDGQSTVPDLAGQKVTQVAAGGRHTVLVLENGSVKTFGGNYFGATAVPDLAGKKVTQAAAGTDHTVLLLEDGSVKAFGWNEHGATTVPDLAGEKVTQAAAGGGHTVLVLEDGSVQAFGLNDDGQTMVPDLAGKKVTQAAAGGVHTVLVLEDGSVKAFGLNDHGQTMVPDLAGKKVTHAAAGTLHTMLVLEDGSVKAFGSNDGGQTTVPDLAGKKVTQAAAGDHHTVLVLSDGIARGLFQEISRPELHAATAILPWVRIDADTDSWLAELVPNTNVYKYIENHWSQTAGPDMVLQRVELLDIQHKKDGLSSYFAQVVAGRGRAGRLDPANINEPDFSSGLTKLKESFLEIAKSNKANYVLSWHGTGYDDRYAVATGGLQPLRTTDGGYFGAGSYTTLTAQYAAEYSEFKPPGANGEYVVLLTLTCVGCAYVITRKRDYANPNDPFAVSKMYSDDPSQAVAILPRYDTHFVPVSAAFHNQACPTADATAFEIVSRETAQCCPMAFCYYTKGP